MSLERNTNLVKSKSFCWGKSAAIIEFNLSSRSRIVMQRFKSHSATEGYTKMSPRWFIYIEEKGQTLRKLKDISCRQKPTFFRLSAGNFVIVDNNLNQTALFICHESDGVKRKVQFQDEIKNVEETFKEQITLQLKNGEFINLDKIAQEPVESKNDIPLKELKTASKLA